MPWYLSDAAIGGAVALVAVAVALALAFRDRYERQLVDFDPTRTKVEFQEGTGLPHRATLSLLNRGNRATVVRDVKLVSADATVILSYRVAGRGCSPSLPLRLDAPDEQVLVLELTNEQEHQLNRIEVEYLGGKGVGRVQWPYVRLSGVAAGGSLGSVEVLTTHHEDSATATDKVEVTVTKGTPAAESDAPHAGR